MKTSIAIQKDVLDIYAELELSKEQRVAIRNKKTEILNGWLQNEGEVFTTDMNIKALINACVFFGIIL